MTTWQILTEGVVRLLLYVINYNFFFFSFFMFYLFIYLLFLIMLSWPFFENKDGEDNKGDVEAWPLKEFTK